MDSARSVVDCSEQVEISTPAYSQVVANILIALAAIMLCSTIAMVVVLASPVPEYDYWDHINWLRGSEQAGKSVQEFFRQANEHRIAVPRLVFVLDDMLARSTGRLDVVVILLSAAVTVVAVLYAHFRRLREERLQAFGLFVAVTLGALFTQSDNFLWENQVQFTFVYMFAAVAILLAIHASAPVRPLSTLIHALTLVAAGACVYSMANGLLVFGPIVLLFLLRRQWWIAALYVVAGAAFAVAYLHGYHRPTYHPNPATALLNAPVVLVHLLLSMGGYVSKMSAAAGGMLGALGIAYVLERSYGWLVRRRPVGRHEVFSLLLVLFILGSMALTSLARAELSVFQGLASRYQTPVNLFWMNVILLLSLDSRLTGIRRRRVVLGVAVALGGLALAGQLYSLRYEIGRASQAAYAEDALAVGAPDPEALERVFPEMAIPLTFTDILRRQHRAQFVDERYYALGQRIEGRPFLALPSAAPTESRLLTWRDREGWLLLMELTGSGERHFNSKVTVTDRCGVVLGFGRLFNSASPRKLSLVNYALGRAVRLRAYLDAGLVRQAAACDGVPLLEDASGAGAQPRLNPAALELHR